MSSRDKVYFASDFHLGAHPIDSSRERERRIVRWLDTIKQDAKALYLLGDVFDFWFEYASAIPRGHTRFMGKLAELADLGIPITFFKGNHDMWMFGYLKEELDAQIIDDELLVNLDGRKFYLHHGDGLGDGDRKYKVLKKVFRSPACQWLFARLHPNLGIGIATRWSKHSRLSSNTLQTFLGKDKEWLIQYAAHVEQNEHFDYYIFGHRHVPYKVAISENSTVINLGEWVNYNTYAVWDGKELCLKTWNG